MRRLRRGDGGGDAAEVDAGTCASRHHHARTAQRVHTGTSVCVMGAQRHEKDCEPAVLHDAGAALQPAQRCRT